MNGSMHDLTGAYAADALDPDERAAFEAHLKTCDRCAAEVRAYHEVAARLASARAADPPPELRDRVLAAAAATGERPAPQTVPVRSPDPVGAPARDRGRWSWLALAAAIAVLVAGGLGAVVVRLGDRVDHLAGEADAIAAVLAADDARTADLSGDGGHGRVMWDPATGRAVVALVAPTPAPGRTYQAWAVVAGTPQPRDTFRPDDDGSAAVVIDVPDDVEAVAVTDEPEGGSTAPTTEPLLVARLQVG